MSNRTFREKYLKGVVESNDEEEATILSELVIARLIEQGVLDQLVMASIQETDADEAQQSVLTDVNTRIRSALAQSAQQLQGVEQTATVAPGTVEDEAAQAAMIAGGV